MISLPPIPFPVFGGELPLACDPLRDAPEPLAPDSLLFSHGRAALAWLIGRTGPFRSALVCAYTCPAVPALLRKLELDITYYDVGAADVAAQARAVPGRVLVIVPAPLGGAPDPDPLMLAAELNDAATVVIDAAQTAFGHLWIDPPHGGAVLSAPRKTTGLADGAVLRLDGASPDDVRAVDGLPRAWAPTVAKLAARALLLDRSPDIESETLALARESEDSWDNTPARMSDRSRHLLPWLDPDEHARVRWANWRRLAAALPEAVERIEPTGGVPFNFSILVDDREAMLTRLRTEKVFATPLWRDTEHDPACHPSAAGLARRLLGLPMDQRYRPEDMDELGRRVRRCLHN